MITPTAQTAVTFFWNKIRAHAWQLHTYLSLSLCTHTENYMIISLIRALCVQIDEMCVNFGIININFQKSQKTIETVIVESMTHYIYDTWFQWLNSVLFLSFISYKLANSNFMACYMWLVSSVKPKPNSCIMPDHWPHDTPTFCQFTHYISIMAHELCI